LLFSRSQTSEPLVTQTDLTNLSRQLEDIKRRLTEGMADNTRDGKENEKEARVEDTFDDDEQSCYSEVRRLRLFF